MKRYVIACVLTVALACGFTAAGSAIAETGVLPETGAAVEGPQPEWLDESPPLPGALDPNDPSQGLSAMTGAYEAGKILAAGIFLVWIGMALLKKFAAGRGKKSKLRLFFEKRWVLWASNALLSIASTIAGKLVIGEHLTWMAAAVVALGILAGSTTGYSAVQDKAEG